MGAPRADFQIQDEGSIVLIVPLTDAAADWLDTNLPEDRLRFGAASVCEHRYSAAVINGMHEDGLISRQHPRGA